MSVVENFEKLLTDFFSIYHPRQVKKVGAIAQEFKGQEVVVLKSLCDKYKKAYKVVPGLVEALEVPAPAPIVEAAPQIEESTEDAASDEESSEEETSKEVVAEETQVDEVSNDDSEEEVVKEEEEEK